MISISFRRWHLFFLLCICIGLAACSTAPEKGREQEITGKGAEATALPPGPITDNPYHRRKPSVSAAAEELFEHALNAMDNQDWDRAKDLLQTLTEKHTRLSGPWVNLALVHRAQGNRQEAQDALQRAIDINPNNLTAYNQLALLKREAGDFDAAETLYRRALAVWPYHPGSHRNLGILYDLYLGQWDKALRHYRAYQQLQDEPDREVTGWIVDLERRQAETKP